METTNDGMVEQLKLARRPYVTLENKIRIKWMNYNFAMDLITSIAKLKFIERSHGIFLHILCRAQNKKKIYKSKSYFKIIVE